MIRPLALTLLSLGAAAATLYGADFWQNKKFPEWNEREVRRMLTDSPWAHAYEHMSANLPPSGGGGRGGRRGGGGGEEGESGGGAPPRPAALIYFRMLSALPVKHAIAKSRYGNEVQTSPDAAKFIARQEASYIVGIAGVPAEMLKGADPASLKSAIQLKVKGKPAVNPNDMQFEKSGNALSFYLMFSRADNPVTVKDGDFQVILKLPSREIKRTFKLKDMVYDGKLEM